MRRKLYVTLPLATLLLAAPAVAQEAQQTESDYLQHRASSLADRIDVAIADHSLSKKRAARLRLAVGRVQTLAGNLQTRNGTIARADADRMNQQLTDVERALPHQR